MYYQGESKPRGYDYPEPETRGGSSVRGEPGPQKQLPKDVVNRVRKSVKDQEPKAPGKRKG